MTIASKLKQYLDENQVKYTVTSHSEAYTAQEVAAAAHIPGRELAKTVIARKGNDFITVVLTATSKVDFKTLSAELGEKVELAAEAEFKNLFPDFEVGAMPPFGNLYNLSVYVDEGLAQDKEIAFIAGTHRDVIRMLYEDFDRLAQPKHLKLAVRA